MLPLRATGWPVADRSPGGLRRGGSCAVFRDPLHADSTNVTEQNLLRLCDMHSVPIATNIATAEVLLRGLDQGDLDYREAMHPQVIDPFPSRRAV